MKGEEKQAAGGAPCARDTAATEEALELTEEELEDVSGGLGVWHSEVRDRQEDVPLWRGW